MEEEEEEGHHGESGDANVAAAARGAASASASASGASAAVVRRPMMRREAAVQAAYLAGAQVHAQQAAVALEAMPPRRTWTTQREDRRGGRVGDACSCSQQGTGQLW